MPAKKTKAAKSTAKKTASPKKRAASTKTKPTKKVAMPALISARQAIEELGVTASQHELLARAEAILTSKRKKNGMQ